MSHGDSHSLLRLIRASSAAEAVVMSVVSLLVGSPVRRVRVLRMLSTRKTLPPLH